MTPTRGTVLALGNAWSDRHGVAYGFMVSLGFVRLAGILINNGIVLIDRIQVQIKERTGREPLTRSFAPASRAYARS